MVLKRTLSIFLAVLMIGMTLTAFPITVNAADVDAAATAEGTVIPVSTKEGLTNACDTINASGGTYTINLTNDIVDGQIKVTHKDAVVTVLGNGHAITTSKGTRHSVVYVEKGATVNLGVEDEDTKLTLSGGDEGFEHTKNDEPGLVYVLPGSTCNMYANVTLENFRGENYFGGGVTVQGGTFHMYGGTIQNCGINGGSVCYGGGVAVFNGGNFIMENGTITDCYATTDYIDETYENCYAGMGGGVFVSDGSVFTMNGGTITKNTATNFGGGVAMTLSDVETKYNPNTDLNEIDYGNPRSRAAINGGTISGNKAKNGAGVFASGLIFAFAQTLATDPLDTGDQLEPGLYINGGENKAVEIYSNTASDTGGGVLAIGLKDPKRAVIKNTDISYNHAKSGAGISVYKYWTKAMIENCHIHDNAASTLGGGIYLDDNKDLGAGTTVKNTVIENNTAGEKGGGIYYKKESVLNIEGADTIQNNTVDGKDNNLYFQGTKYPVNVTGSIEGSKIGITDARLFEDNLEDYYPEAQSSLRLTEGFKTQNPSLVPETAFTSDHESWYVDYGDLEYKEVASDEDYYTYKGQKYEVVSRTDSGESCTGNLFFVKANLFETGIAEDPTVFKNEVLSRFNDTSKYTAGYNDGMWYDFTNIATGDLVTICFPNEYNARIYLNDPGSYYNSNILIATSTGHQTKYADSGEFVFQYYYAATYDNIVYSNSPSPTPVDIHRNELIEQDEEIYEYDELGHITSKTEISNPPAKTPHQVETVLDYDYTNEVRLVHRTKVDYHINNEYIDDHYNNNDIFTSYVEAATKDVKVGETIDEFYTVPEVVPTAANSCPYIFKGWYYDPENDNDSHPVQFGTDKYAKDIYAHWIKVDNVTKDADDTTMFQDGGDTYGGFDLAGVQIRKKMLDHNFEEVTPGGMRFITSLNMDVVNEINKIKPNNIEYGYVAATHEGWIEYHSEGVKHGLDEKLKYVSETANGIDTSSAKATNENYFGFAKNVNCTSKVTDSKNGVVRRDHQNFDKYLLYSLVITYEDAGSNKGKDVLARPYIRYKDANGLERVAYSEYTGTNVLGGCYTNYKRVADMAGS